VSELDEDFASMFEASIKAKRIEKGQTIEGTIVGIGHEVAFVNVGGKGEALLDLAELRNEDGTLEAGIGDTVHALVVSTDGGITLSRRLARGAATDRQLEEAYDSGLPVEGKVEREVKGGFEIKVGRSRGFCPFSQIDIIRGTDPAQHIGRVYPFRITEYKEGGRSLVLSRRALLEEEQRESADAVRKSIVPGAVLTGTVVSVRDFGAFIDLGGGIQGLLHVSEMGWSRVTDPSLVARPGESITVKVLRVDEATQKIALGLKQLLEDPWATVASRYEVGQVRPGRVTRVSDFGAFVELEAGVEGLAHASSFPPTGHSKGWVKSVPPGLTAPFEILSIDIEKKRIGVALVQEGASQTAGAEPGAQTAIVPGARLTGKVERHEKFGVFVFLAPGRTGLMPWSETGIAREADAAKALPIGSDVDVIVLETDPSGRRIRVSHKAAQDAQDAEEMREYNARADARPADGFGSLADKLRGALDK
jgi:small subunit ribosomal protein S1